MCFPGTYASWRTLLRIKSTISCVEVPGWNTATHDHQNILHAAFTQQLADARDDGVVRSGEDRNPDDIHIFLDCSTGNLLGGLPKAGVNHFHAGVAQSARHNFGPAIMPVEARLGNNYANSSIDLGHWIME